MAGLGDRSLKLVLWVVGVAVCALAYLDFCDLVYDCGCAATWAGAADACNIHNPTPPHCPWCSYGWLGAALPFAAVVAVQGLLALKLEAPFWVRAVAVLAAFPVVAGIAAVVFGLSSGYWGV